MPDIKDLNVARNKWPLFVIGLPGRCKINGHDPRVQWQSKFVGETNMYGGVHV